MIKTVYSNILLSGNMRHTKSWTGSDPWYTTSVTEPPENGLVWEHVWVQPHLTFSMSLAISRVVHGRTVHILGLKTLVRRGTDRLKFLCQFTPITHGIVDRVLCTFSYATIETNRRISVSIRVNATDSWEEGILYVLGGPTTLQRCIIVH